MRFHVIRCPNCNAELEIEDGIDTFFCKYCGTKIIVDGQSDAIIKAKADIRKAEIEKELREKEMTFELRQQEQKSKDSFRNGLLAILASGILLLFGSCSVKWF